MQRIKYSISPNNRMTDGINPSVFFCLPKKQLYAIIKLEK